MLSIAAAATLFPAVASAAGPAEGGASGEASGTVELGGETSGEASGEVDAKWIKRHPPKPLTAELGIFGGMIFLSSQHGLFEEGLVENRREYNRAAADLGVRLGFYPIRHFGLEVEGAGIPTRAGGDPASLLFARAHAVAQIGLWSVTPFLLIGGGGMGVDSPSSVHGADLDPSLHFGGGVKMHLNEFVALRLDIRDNVSKSCLDCGADPTENGLRAHHPEILLGLSLTLALRKKEKVEAATVAPPLPPPPPRDTDGDRILDVDDACVTVPETYNDFQDGDGCPEYDKDGDGFWNLPDQDACPDVPGVAPDGCPPNVDTDGDGILDPDDQCVKDPETKNGFQDQDGCPDEIPKEVQKFVGVIQGIFFDTNKDSIKPQSEVVLQEAIVVFQKYPDIRVKISGHTDIRGSHEHNMDLSRRRAGSVKNWLVEHGMNASRLETEGFGPDEPIADNKSKSGRAKNRRIEFEILQ
jgi:OOP family OmpA-OmpF porin